MSDCQMPQGHPSRCGCAVDQPDRYADPAYCRAVEQERNFLRGDRDAWALKWQKAVTYGATLEQQRDSLLTALEALLEHEGTVDHTGIGDFPSEALQTARSHANSVIATVKNR